MVPTPRHPREWRKDVRITRALERARGRETEPTQSKVLWRFVNAVGGTGAKVVNINSRGHNTSRALETIEHFESALQKGLEKKLSMRTQLQLNNFVGENNLTDLLRQEARAEVSSQLQRWKPQENNTQEPPSSSQKKCNHAVRRISVRSTCKRKGPTSINSVISCSNRNKQRGNQAQEGTPNTEQQDQQRRKQQQRHKTISEQHGSDDEDAMETNLRDVTTMSTAETCTAMAPTILVSTFPEFEFLAGLGSKR